MVCSELELGLSEEHEGILVLPEDAPVGQPLREYLGDEILEIDLTPDMARCLSMWGIAREVHALTEGALHLPEDEDAAHGNDHASSFLTAQIDDPDLCQRFTGTIIRDIEVGPSPKWMQDRLVSAGMRPINNIVDITNFVMLETGQPLHAFDYDLLVDRATQIGESTPTIIVRTAKENEALQTLDGQQRKLQSSMLVIADKAGAVRNCRRDGWRRNRGTRQHAQYSARGGHIRRYQQSPYFPGLAPAQRSQPPLHSRRSSYAERSGGSASRAFDATTCWRACRSRIRRCLSGATARSKSFHLLQRRETPVGDGNSLCLRLAPLSRGWISTLKNCPCCRQTRPSEPYLGWHTRTESL